MPLWFFKGAEAFPVHDSHQGKRYSTTKNLQLCLFFSISWSGSARARYHGLEESEAFPTMLGEITAKQRGFLAPRSLRLGMGIVGAPHPSRPLTHCEDEQKCEEERVNHFRPAEPPDGKSFTQPG